MRQNWYCVTDLPSRDKAPASKPLGLIREHDEMTPTAPPRAAEIIIDPHDPSRYWDYFGGTD